VVPPTQGELDAQTAAQNAAYPWSWDSRRLTFGCNKGEEFWRVTGTNEKWCRWVLSVEPETAQASLVEYRQYLIDRGFPSRKYFKRQ
jgi:hypothetical protein